MRRFLQVLSVLMFLLSASIFQRAQDEPKLFHGTLDGKLHCEPKVLTPFEWAAVNADAVNLPEKITNFDRVFEGIFLFGSKRIKGALIERADGQRTLYVDLNGNQTFEGDERFSFRPSGSDTYESETEFSLPLTGRYSHMPVIVRLLRADSTKVSRSPQSISVLYTPTAYVQGSVHLPSRPSLLVRYSYDIVKNEVDLASALQFVDTDGDGKFDSFAEREVPEGDRAMIFQIDDLYVVTMAVDLANQSFTLRAVPGSAYRRIDLRKGSVIPDFEFTDFDGKHKRLSDIQAKYRLIVFWASWCGPCVFDLPIEKALYDRFHSRGFEIIGINGDETIDKARELLLKNGASWPEALLDSTRELIKDRFRITAWPQAVLIDEKGKIVAAGVDASSKNLDITLSNLLSATP